jgi:hypothetical protein
VYRETEADDLYPGLQHNPSVYPVSNSVYHQFNGTHELTSFKGQYTGQSNSRKAGMAELSVTNFISVSTISLLHLYDGGY